MAEDRRACGRAARAARGVRSIDRRGILDSKSTPMKTSSLESLLADIPMVLGVLALSRTVHAIEPWPAEIEVLR
ncbi:hypothetical protein [Nannocystis punicea]|uniref:Uncharacterized protein n=1 Tax=Nannocystis punicea TaxID=2995304 RepID=A0ABY7HAB1_9BACT|nr:hypothetical protein [Nannocystis poenicansa]WAS96050.1 hypothetical protein O0S08_07785 [Nannocystis poenicansa]